MTLLLIVIGLIGLALILSPRLRHLTGYLVLVWIGHGTKAMIRTAKAALRKRRHG